MFKLLKVVLKSRNSTENSGQKSIELIFDRHKNSKLVPSVAIRLRTLVKYICDKLIHAKLAVIHDHVHLTLALQLTLCLHFLSPEEAAP